MRPCRGWLVLASVLVLAVTARAGTPPKLAAPNWSGVNVAPALVTFLSDHFAQQLRLAGAHVITSGEMATLLGMERQRQLMNCVSGESSCLAELASALGADGLIVGSLGRFDRTFQLNINILSTRTGATLATHSQRVDGEKELLDGLTQAAQRIEPILEGRAQAPAASVELSPTAPSRPVNWALWGTAAAGIAAGTLGTYFFIDAKSQHDLLTNPGTSLPYGQVQGVHDTGQRDQVLGFVMGGVAVAALTGAGIWAWKSMPASADAVHVALGSRSIHLVGTWR